MNFRADAVLNYAGKVGESVVGFVTLLYVANALGAGAVGAYALSVALATWLTLPANAFGRALSKRASEAGAGGYITAGAGLATAATLLVLAGIGVAAPFIRQYTGTGAPLVAALTLSLAAHAVGANAFMARELAGYVGLISTVDRVVRLALTVALVTLGWGVTGVVIAHVAGLTLSWTGALAYYRDTIAPGRPTREQARSLVVFARHSWLDVLRAKAMNWTDTLVLGVFAAPALVGIYEVAWRLGNATGLVGNSIRSALVPRISTTADDGLDRAKRLLEDALPYPGVVAIPAVFGALALGDRIFMLYGPTFVADQSTVVLVLLLSAACLGAYSQQFMAALNAIDAHRTAYYINAAVVGTNVVLNVALVWAFGWTGAAVATLTAFALALGLGYVRLSARIGDVSLPVRTVGGQVSAAAVMAVAVGALVHARPAASVSWLLVLVGVGAAVYGTILVATNGTVRGLLLALLAESRTTI